MAACGEHLAVSDPGNRWLGATGHAAAQGEDPCGAGTLSLGEELPLQTHTHTHTRFRCGKKLLVFYSILHFRLVAGAHASALCHRPQSGALKKPASCPQV